MQPGAKLQAYLGVIILQPHACTQRFRLRILRRARSNAGRTSGSLSGRIESIWETPSKRERVRTRAAGVPEARVGRQLGLQHPIAARDCLTEGSSRWRTASGVSFASKTRSDAAASCSTRSVSARSRLHGEQPSLDDAPSTTRGGRRAGAQSP